MPPGPRLMSQFPFWFFYPMCCVILAFVNVFCIRSWLGKFIRSSVNMFYIRSWLSKFIRPLVFQFCIWLSGQHRKYGYSSPLTCIVVYHYGQCFCMYGFWVFCIWLSQPRDSLSVLLDSFGFCIFLLLIELAFTWEKKKHTLLASLTAHPQNETTDFTQYIIKTDKHPQVETTTEFTQYTIKTHKYIKKHVLLIAYMAIPKDLPNL